MSIVNDHLNYVDEIVEYANELNEKSKYDSLNKVIMQDKKLNKTLQKMNKE